LVDNCIKDMVQEVAKSSLNKAIEEKEHAEQEFDSL
jgi:hypothetical protein